MIIMKKTSKLIILILMIFAKVGSGRKFPRPKVTPTPSVSVTPSGESTYEPFLL